MFCEGTVAGLKVREDGVIEHLYAWEPAINVCEETQCSAQNLANKRIM